MDRHEALNVNILSSQDSVNDFHCSLRLFQTLCAHSQTIEPEWKLVWVLRSNDFGKIIGNCIVNSEEQDFTLAILPELASLRGGQHSKSARFESFFACSGDEL